MTQLAIGEATPHGATYDGHGVNFTLFSAHAERVELCVFDSRGMSVAMTCRDVAAMSGMVIWQAPAGFALWLSRTWPVAASAGHRFNPAKLLLDPYARRVEGELKIIRCCTADTMNRTTAITRRWRRA